MQQRFSLSLALEPNDDGKTDEEEEPLVMCVCVWWECTMRVRLLCLLWGGGEQEE